MRNLRALSLSLCALAAARMAPLGPGPLGGARRAGAGGAARALAAPYNNTGPSTGDCDSSKGTLPPLARAFNAPSVPLAANQYAMVGCDNPVWGSMSALLSVTQAADDNLALCVARDADCRQAPSGETPCIARYSALGPPLGPATVTLTQACGGTSTCCLIFHCNNVLRDCNGRASYTVSFYGILRGGIIAGIVVGTVIIAVLAGCACRAWRRRRLAAAGAAGGGAYSALPPPPLAWGWRPPPPQPAAALPPPPLPPYYSPAPPGHAQPAAYYPPYVPAQ